VIDRRDDSAAAAWISLGLIAALAVVAIWLATRRPSGALSFDVDTAVLLATFLFPAPVGALVASRRPRHPVGWLMLVVAFLVCTSGVLAETSRQLHAGHPELGAALFLASDMLFKPGLLLIGLLLLLFPTGRLPSNRWRPIVVMGITAAVLAMVLEVIAPGALRDYALRNPPRNPFGVPAFATLAPLIDVSLFITFFGFLLLAATSVPLRFRHAGPELRLQLKWFMLAGVALVASLVAGNVFILVTRSGQGWSPVAVEIPELVAAAGLAASIAIAILRHRLFDIELVISRAVAYGALAALITAFYIGVVAGVGSLFIAGSASRLLLAVIATAAVAAAFQPLRARVERLANRLVYGPRAVPYEILADFTSRLEGTHSSLDLLPTMARMLAAGTGSDAATVWLREKRGEVPAGTFPEQALVSPEAATRSVTVRHAGDCLGHLAVFRRSRQSLTPTEERLMDGLASQAGLVLRNAGLHDELGHRLTELRQSRHRLVAAQDEAQRRLERDLHDGAQQNLVSLRMKLGLAAGLARNRPQDLEQLVREMQDELGTALDSLRTLARGVYPPLLEAEGLRAALRARARQVPVGVDVRCGPERYPRELEAAVYFCCSEALQNVTKHSLATHGSVRVWREEGQLWFEVRDNGRGFDPEAAANRGGLQNLRDRLDVLGGRLDVTSTAGSGTSVTGWLPLPTEGSR
jgi:signal transduction histidine kinase